MRDIKYIVIHCTATSQDTKVASIVEYWKKRKKWRNPGYHYIIPKSGIVKQLHDTSKLANGAKDYNKESIHLAYVGGVDENKNAIDNRTKAQEESMFNLILELHEKFPKAEILGHRDLPKVRKSCPSFDVKNWLAYYVPDLGEI